MTAAPKFGISFSFQAHRASGQAWDTVYRLLFHPLQPGMALKDAVADLECVARTIVPRICEKLAAA